MRTNSSNQPLMSPPPPAPPPAPPPHRLYPPDAKAPNGKARLLYEVAPMSMIAEQAGGIACIGPLVDQRVLDVVPQTVHQKSPLFVGSAGEMRQLQAFLKARAAAK